MPRSVCSYTACKLSWEGGDLHHHCQRHRPCFKSSTDLPIFCQDCVALCFTLKSTDITTIKTWNTFITASARSASRNQKKERFSKSNFSVTVKKLREWEALGHSALEHFMEKTPNLLPKNFDFSNMSIPGPSSANEAQRPPAIRPKAKPKPSLSKRSTLPLLPPPPLEELVTRTVTFDTTTIEEDVFPTDEAVNQQEILFDLESGEPEEYAPSGPSTSISRPPPYNPTKISDLTLYPLDEITDAMELNPPPPLTGSSNLPTSLTPPPDCTR